MVSSILSSLCSRSSQYLLLLGLGMLILSFLCAISDNGYILPSKASSAIPKETATETLSPSPTSTPTSPAPATSTPAIATATRGLSPLHPERFELGLSNDGRILSIRMQNLPAGHRVWFDVWADKRRVGPLCDQVVDDQGNLTVEAPLSDQALIHDYVQISAAVADSETILRMLSSPFPIHLPSAREPEPRYAENVAAAPPPPAPVRPHASRTPPVCTATCTPLPPPPTPTITPTPSPTPISMDETFPQWHAEYFNNLTFAGEPVHQDNCGAILFDWGGRSPCESSLGKNFFSARWVRKVTIPKDGTYTFYLFADDYAALKINGEQVLTYRQTRNGSNQMNKATRFYQKGMVLDMELSYVEYLGQAGVRFYWTPEEIDGSWHGAYYRNANLTGDVVREDHRTGDPLTVEWGKDLRMPEASERDENGAFSVRWTRLFLSDLPANHYYLCVYAHHGVEVFLDGQRLIDGPNRYQDVKPHFACHPASLRSTGLPHDLRLNYYYYGGVDDPMLGLWVVPQQQQPLWAGAFFDNFEMEGLPGFVDMVPQINFPDGAFSADPRLPDNFAVHWQRVMTAIPGHHTINLLCDDGVVFEINDKRLVDEWHEDEVESHTLAYDVTGGPQKIMVELDYFHQESGHSPAPQLALQWTQPTPTPTATSTPSPTPSPTPTHTPTSTPTSTPTPTPTLCCVTPTPSR